MSNDEWRRRRLVIRHWCFDIESSFGNSPFELPLGEVALPREGALQPSQVIFRADLHAAEALQVRRARLRVEQLVAAVAQALHEVDEGDLARVALEVEHALAEERRPDAHAVE